MMYSKAKLFIIFTTFSLPGISLYAQEKQPMTSLLPLMASPDTRLSPIPKFPGNIYEYLGKHIRYPEPAWKVKAGGRVVLEFIVDEDGNILNPEVRKSSGNEALDNEALRVIKCMPRWIPARNNGVPVKVSYTLPITFSVD